MVVPGFLSRQNGGAAESIESGESSGSCQFRDLKKRNKQMFKHHKGIHENRAKKETFFSVIFPFTPILLGNLQSSLNLMSICLHVKIFFFAYVHHLA